MARYGMDFNRNRWPRDPAMMGYDRDFGGRGAWSGGPRDWNQSWESDYGYGYGEGRGGNWNRGDRGWMGGERGWDRGWGGGSDYDRMNRGWGGINRDWRNDEFRGQGWGHENDRDLGDRMRAGWNRMRRGVRDMMHGGYDRGW